MAAESIIGTRQQVSLRTTNTLAELQRKPPAKLVDAVIELIAHQVSRTLLAFEIVIKSVESQA